MSRILILTPGHSPHHEGAVSVAGVPECLWAHAVAGLTLALCYGLDVEVWTRRGGDLSALIRRINADRDVGMAVDVHFDASATTTARGVSALVAPGASVAAREMAALLAEEVCRETGLPRRGVVERGDLGYLTGTECPAVIIEAGFGTSPDDWPLMRPEVVATGIAVAIRRWRA